MEKCDLQVRPASGIASQHLEPDLSRGLWKHPIKLFEIPLRTTIAARFSQT
ncbi:hypothetical protein ACPOL_3192 [Acidisarcina polymorpha]|uniref:Uncharacterized protein n=1 Tax=Acidisarcina polymorpha TaxID=2211140 RepID=A0A2Z5G187_9BACT|nr:hypothetical protein ACPOL_3192 [Acidisarcina polymorpha]